MLCLCNFSNYIKKDFFKRCIVATFKYSILPKVYNVEFFFHKLSRDIMKQKEFKSIITLTLLVFLHLTLLRHIFVVGVENDENISKSLFKISSVDVGGTYDVREYQNYGYAATNDGVHIIDLQNIRDPEEIRQH